MGGCGECSVGLLAGLLVGDGEVGIRETRVSRGQWRCPWSLDTSTAVVCPVFPGGLWPEDSGAQHKSWFPPLWSRSCFKDQSRTLK